MSKLMIMNLIKKNRRFWVAKDENGNDVKILINDESENLTTGKHELRVVGETGYNPETQYRVVPLEEEMTNIKIKDIDNMIFRSGCRSMGGRYDNNEGVWIFSHEFADSVKELEEIFNSKKIKIKITNRLQINSAYRLEFAGYQIAVKTGGARNFCPSDGVVYIKSDAPITHGSSAALPEGSVFIFEIPEKVLDAYAPSIFEIEKIEE